MLAAQKNDMALSKHLVGKRAGAGNKDMVTLMLFGGADVNVVNNKGGGIPPCVRLLFPAKGLFVN